MPAARSYKPFFSRFLEAAPERVHFAAHSHHFWPDVSYEAHVQSWLDAARFADRKWDAVFGELWPKAQAHVARILELPDPTTVAFAPNTHELVSRILSALDARVPRILTTDGEFHSFARQSRRLAETGDAEVVRVPVEPLSTFVERFVEQAQSDRFDLVLLSHVMFGSGFVVPGLDRIAEAIDPATFVVIDGYHGFVAIPTSLAAIASRVFYVAGGYKYAMSGEGVCFVHAPPGYGERPRNTGWFASFGALADSGDDRVEYAPGGARFLGATFDPTAIHRFVAVMDWLERERIEVADIHAHVCRLQERFVRALRASRIPLRESDLVVPVSEPRRGHFLTFRRPDAAELHAKLLEAAVVTDVRGDRLRVGFGLYHDDEDIVRGIERMESALG